MLQVLHYKFFVWPDLPSAQFAILHFGLVGLILVPSCLCSILQELLRIPILTQSFGDWTPVVSVLQTTSSVVRVMAKPYHHSSLVISPVLLPPMNSQSNHLMPFPAQGLSR